VHPTTGDRVALPDGAEAVLTPLADGWLLRPVEARTVRPPT